MVANGSSDPPTTAQINGYSTGVLELDVFMELTGPHRLSTDPDNTELFGRLEEFGIHYDRLPRQTERSQARRFWLEELGDRGVSRPWELLDAAIKDGPRIRANAKPLGFQVAGNEFAPVSMDIFLNSCQDTEQWIVDGYAAREVFTIVAGPPKIGKSSFCGGMAAASAYGTSFIDRKVEQTPTLWVDLEQPEKRTRALFRELGVEGLPLYIFSRTGAKIPLTALSAYIREHNIGLCVVDSLSKLWDVVDENDARQVEAALTAIAQVARETNCALVLIHHTRKSGGEDAEELRGSSAVAANADIVLSFKRHKPSGDTARLIEGTSRYQETPRRIVVAFQNGLYRVLGNPTDLKHDAQRNQLLETVSAEPQTADALAQASELPQRTAYRLVGELYGEGILAREGTGKKGDAFRFSRKD